MTQYEKPSKEQFQAYVDVQQSGLTNMWDIGYVQRLSAQYYKVKLKKEHCFYIMKHYAELKKEYQL